MATKFSVVYDNGTTEIYMVKPKHILKIERDKGGLDASLEASYSLAWLAAATGLGFDEWLDTVEDIAPVDQEEVAEGESANPF